MADLTFPQQMRAAATLLRAAERPGPVGLALASLREDLSRLAADHPIDPGYAGMPVHRWCTGCNDEECDALSLLDRARELMSALGTTPPAPAPAIHAQETHR